jgi:hypothetical protein
MTISDRYIGKAWLAWIMARCWLWSLIYGALPYLPLFSWGAATA